MTQNLFELFFPKFQYKMSEFVCF